MPPPIFPSHTRKDNYQLKTYFCVQILCLWMGFTSSLRRLVTMPSAICKTLLINYRQDSISSSLPYETPIPTFSHYDFTPLSATTKFNSELERAFLQPTIICQLTGQMRYRKVICFYLKKIYIRNGCLTKDDTSFLNYWTFIEYRRRRQILKIESKSNFTIAFYHRQKTDWKYNVIQRNSFFGAANYIASLYPFSITSAYLWIYFKEITLGTSCTSTWLKIQPYLYMHRAWAYWHTATFLTVEKSPLFYTSYVPLSRASSNARFLRVNFILRWQAPLRV